MYLTSKCIYFLKQVRTPLLYGQNWSKKSNGLFLQILLSHAPSCPGQEVKATLQCPGINCDNCVYYTYDSISKPALISTWKWRTISAPKSWPHAFWLKLAITGRLRAALQAQNSSLSQNPKPMPLKSHGVSETARSGHTSAMLCNSWRDKWPAGALRRETARGPGISVPLPLPSELLLCECCTGPVISFQREHSTTAENKGCMMQIRGLEKHL